MNFSGLIRRFSTEQSGEDKSHQVHGGITSNATANASGGGGGGGGLFSGSSKIFDSVKKTGLVTDISSKFDQLKRRTSLEAMGIVDKEVEPGHQQMNSPHGTVPTPVSPSVLPKPMNVPLSQPSIHSTPMKYGVNDSQYAAVSSHQFNNSMGGNTVSSNSGVHSSATYNVYPPAASTSNSTSSSGMYSSGMSGSSVSSNMSSSSHQYRASDISSRSTPVAGPNRYATDTNNVPVNYTATQYSNVDAFSISGSLRTQSTTGDVTGGGVASNRGEGATSPLSTTSSSRRDSQTEGQVKRPRPPVPPPPRQASITTSASDVDSKTSTITTASRHATGTTHSSSVTSTPYSNLHAQNIPDVSSRSQQAPPTTTPSMDSYQSYTNVKGSSSHEQIYGQRPNPFPAMSSNNGTNQYSQSWQTMTGLAPTTSIQESHVGGDLDSITRMECQKFVSAMGSLMMSTGESETNSNKREPYFSEVANKSGASSSASEYGDEGDRPIYDEDDNQKEIVGKSALERRQSTASIESTTEERGSTEMRDFMRRFVDGIFDSNYHDVEDQKPHFKQYLENHSCRTWFARQLEQWAMRTHCLSEGTFFRLLEYVTIVMVECEDQEDYVALKDLLEASMRFFCEMTTSAGSKTNLSLYKFYQGLSVWQSLRYWNAAVFEDVQKMRFQLPSVLKDQQPSMANSKVTAKDSIDVTVIRNHLSRMMQLGINKDLCLELIRKQGQANNITSSDVQLLRAHVNQHPTY